MCLYEKGLDFKSGIHILNRYFKATTGKTAPMEEAYPSSSKPSKSRSLLLHHHKCSQETQSTSLPFSASIHQPSHYPHAETKQNLITHVARLLAIASQSEIISYLLTDWWIKFPEKRLPSSPPPPPFLPSFLPALPLSHLSFFPPSLPHFNKLCHALQGSLPTTFWILTPHIHFVGNVRQLQEHCFTSITAYHATIINICLCRWRNVTED